MLKPLLVHFLKEFRRDRKSVGITKHCVSVAVGTSCRFLSIGFPHKNHLIGREYLHTRKAATYLRPKDRLFVFERSLMSFLYQLMFGSEFVANLLHCLLRHMMTAGNIIKPAYILVENIPIGIAQQLVILGKVCRNQSSVIVGHLFELRLKGCIRCNHLD